MDKHKIRQDVYQKRKKLSTQWVEEASRVIFQRLQDYMEVWESECPVKPALYVYASYQNEVDTWPFIRKCLEEKRMVALPRVHKDHVHMDFYYIESLDDIEEGYKGIPQPKLSCKKAENTSPAIMIQPGVAFDAHGNRIGYGKGFYDRYLQGKVFLKRIAIAFEFQMYDEIQPGEFDIPVEMVITEKSVYGR